jgi:L-rhamnose-H+ transport protein
MSVISGVIFHALGGGASASFYMPFKKVKLWAWESYWLVNGVSAWIVMPLVVGFLSIPNLFGVLSASPSSSILWSYFFGVLWGIGGLTFGLSMRYLGISLGYAVTLGFCAAFGTIIPPLFEGQFMHLFANRGGVLIMAGVLVCLGGIGVCGWAGIRKEKELPREEKIKSILEFDFKKGMVVAIVSGVLSACMAFGLAAGKPIAEMAIAHGANHLWQNNAILVVVLWGGFTTNFIWCTILNLKNKTLKDYKTGSKKLLTNNYIFSSLAGAIWYMQFFFYGMGSTQMGRFDFISWTLHMSFIIALSNIWGLYLKEWKGTSVKTKNVIVGGIFIILLSIVLIGYGTKIG